MTEIHYRLYLSTACTSVSDTEMNLVLGYNRIKSRKDKELKVSRYYNVIRYIFKEEILKPSKHTWEQLISV